MEPVREAAFAGRFYPADPGSCLRTLGDFARSISPFPAVGGLAPHAGWMYSGLTAARTIASVASSSPTTIVIFGAVHVPYDGEAVLYPSGTWMTPLGAIEVDADLAAEVAALGDIESGSEPHTYEHSIEVQLPMVMRWLPSARILPIMVNPSDRSGEIGHIVARAAVGMSRRIAFLGSSDLTHYGPDFSFEPHGHGAAGLRWSRDVNDRRFIELVLAMDESRLVPEAALHRNACGAGAVAALLGAMREIDADVALELEHTTSADRSACLADQENCVGYASIVFRPKCWLPSE
jgi:AmmeMemoRadiSam system protein B